MTYRCEQYGFFILPREEFFKLDRLEGFKLEDYSKSHLTEETAYELDRASMVELQERARKFEGAYVLYDLYSDQDGFLLVGDDPDELSSIACQREMEIAA